MMCDMVSEDAFIRNKNHNIFKSHVCQNVRLVAISSGWVWGVYGGLKNQAKNWIKNVVYTS